MLLKRLSQQIQNIEAVLKTLAWISNMRKRTHIQTHTKMNTINSGQNDCDKNGLIDNPNGIRKMIFDIRFHLCKSFQHSNWFADCVFQLSVQFFPQMLHSKMQNKHKHFTLDLNMKRKWRLKIVLNPCPLCRWHKSHSCILGWFLCTTCYTHTQHSVHGATDTSRVTVLCLQRDKYGMQMHLWKRSNNSVSMNWKFVRLNSMKHAIRFSAVWRLGFWMIYRPTWFHVIINKNTHSHTHTHSMDQRWLDSMKFEFSMQKTNTHTHIFN